MMGVDFSDTTPADQRHTQAVIGDHFSDIDDDEQGDDATSQFLDEDVDDKAQPPIGGVSVTRGTCDDTDTHMTADVAGLVADTDDALSATDPPGTTCLPASWWRPLTCLTALHGRPHTPPRTWPLLSPSIWLGTPTTTKQRLSLPPPTRVVIDTDPNPVTTDIFADEHVSRFLRHARRRAEDRVAGLVVDAAPPDTNTGVVVDPAPGVAAPVVAVAATGVPAWMSALPMVYSLTMLTSIQPRPGAIVMRPGRWHPMVPSLDQPHLIRLRLVEVTPRRRCLSALAEWLAACPTGDSELVLLPTRFYLMMWSTLIRTRLGMTVMRSRQHYREPRESERRAIQPYSTRHSQRSASAAPSHTWQRSRHRHGFWRLAV